MPNALVFFMETRIVQLIFACVLTSIVIKSLGPYAMEFFGVVGWCFLMVQ